jgi:16S rRNA processing protein RimM
MNYIYIGDVVNTHGLKGEVRLLSDFKFKDSVFKNGMKFYIGKNKNEEIVNTYRKHKNYDMVTFIDRNHIEDVLIYKNEPVYVNRDDIEYEGYLDEDLIGLEVYCEDKHIGHVDSILKTNAHDILVVKNGSKHMIPNIAEFIDKVDLENKRLDIVYMKGLLNED